MAFESDASLKQATKERGADPQSAVAVWDPNEPVRQLATGFGFTEGPIWDSRHRRLIFSDIPNDQMLQWSRQAGVCVFRSPSNMANGNAVDREGRIITCEHRTSRVVRTETDETLSVIASHWQASELNSPNDVVAARNGAIYFTDPPYGRLYRFIGGIRPVSQPVMGVYRIGEDGRISRIAEDFATPNGLCFSADKRRLYVADTKRRHIRALDLDDAGRVVAGEIIANVPSGRLAAPDGLKIDSAGRLYCTGEGGIHVFTDNGAHIALIPVPELVANMTFGDDDLRTLYITASSSLYATRVATPGLAAF